MQRMPEIFTSLHPLIVQQTNVGLGILWEVTTLLVLLLTQCLGDNFLDELLHLKSLLISYTMDRS